MNWMFTIQPVIRNTPMPTAKPRLHHKINWRRTVPMILSERHRKVAARP